MHKFTRPGGWLTVWGEGTPWGKIVDQHDAFGRVVCHGKVLGPVLVVVVSSTCAEGRRLEPVFEGRLLLCAVVAAREGLESCGEVLGRPVAPVPTATDVALLLRRPACVSERVQVS